jgi:transposase-like protein
MHVQRKETRFRGRPRIDGLWGPVVCRTQGLGRSGIAARKRESTSRKHRVTLATLSEWRDRFLAGGEACLKSRETDVEDEEKKRLKAVVASVCVDNELLREKIARMENGRPLAFWRSKP